MSTAAETLPSESSSKVETIAWSPQPRQARLISCAADEIFFGGSRGGGKTDGVIGMIFARANQYGDQFKCLVLRRSLKAIQHFEVRLKEIYGKVYALKECWSQQQKVWTFPNGATVWLNYCDTDDDLQQYQGHGYCMICVEELTQWPREDTYEWLFTILRSPSVPCQLVSTGNPGGPGMGWVKERFIKIAAAETITKIHIKSPREGEPDLVRSRVFIPSKLSDNIYLQNTQYEATLLSLPERQRMMYYEGRWDFTDGAFFDEWDPTIHVCRAFNPPKGVGQRWMSMDWGYDDPYCVHWWWQNPAGKIYVYRELAGVMRLADPMNMENRAKKSKGVREKAAEVAKKIRLIEAQHEEHITERWADYSIFDDNGGEQSIGDSFDTEGICFEKAKKANKAYSVQLLRQLLQVRNGISQLQIMDNCPYTIDTIPFIQSDPHKEGQYDTRGDDHPLDSLLYGCRKNVPSMEEGLILQREGVRRQARSFGSGGWR